jgi:hypothetical protein
MQVRGYWLQHLRGPSPNTPAAYQRDGLLFQLISWVAAVVTYSVDTRLRPPHAITAHKGVDNLFLCPVGGANGSTKMPDLRIVVCEDKASERPRDTVRDEVWPAFRDFESGARDHQLIPEITMMLADIHEPQRDLAIDQVFALPKWYRVSLALDSQPSAGLFAGYDVQIPGAEIARRRGEYLITPQPLREWLMTLSAAVADYLESLPAV